MLLALLACADPTATDSKDSATDSATDSPTDSPTGSTTTDTGYHPGGYDAADQHGMDAKHQADDCLGCHGDDLGGGSSGESCDGCHEAGWRTDCVYCHGGTDDSTGAPPEDIDDATTDLSFPEHGAHVQATDLHVAFACDQCHLTPTDPLSEGHFFVSDSSPGVAEVSFATSLSAAGSYSSGTCSDLWCHGDGAGDDGEVSTGDSVADCEACHEEARLDGDHEEHLREGIGCEECHPDTALDDSTINDPAFHVDGAVEVGMPAEVSWDGLLCDGECHGEMHSARPW